MSPRWRKVRADLTRRRSRTVLAILSLVVGVFAIGTIQLGTDDIQRSFRQAFQDSNPPSVLMVTEPFEPALVEQVIALAEVDDAEARRRLPARLLPVDRDWANIELVSMPDFAENRISQINADAGTWPPSPGGIVLERATATDLGIRVGDEVMVQVPGQDPFPLVVEGTAHEFWEVSPMFGGPLRGYVSMDTAELMTGSRLLNSLYVRAAENPLARAQALMVSAVVRDEVVEPLGLAVERSQIREPGEHAAQRVLDAMVITLRLLSAFIFVLACVLVVNTMSALLAEQRQQLGVMKAVGATRRQLATLYLGYSLALQIVALLIAVPLAIVAGRAMAGFFATLLNVDVLPLRVPWSMLGIVAVVALVVPGIAVMWAVIRASGRTVRESISDYGLSAASSMTFLARLKVLRTPGRLGLRNTFRNRARLGLTVATVALTGALLIALLSTDRSLGRVSEEIAGYTNYDVELVFSEPVPLDEVAPFVAGLPSVASVEGWLRRDAFRIRPDGTENENIFLVGLPADSQSIEPTLIEGRWLATADEFAIVVNHDFLEEEADLEVGGEVVLHIEGERTTWRIVGAVTTQLIGPMAYVPGPVLAEVTGNAGSADMLAVNLVAGQAVDPATDALEQALVDAGQPLVGIQTNAEIRAGTEGLFNLLVWTLLVVAGLLGVVAIVGVTGTMTLGVLERTREIGVLRTVGATNGAIYRVLLSEGLTIGLLGWVLGAILSVPVTWFLAQAIGRAFLLAPLSFAYSWLALGLWLPATLMIGVLGALRPARAASRLTIRETLAYE